MVAPVATCNVNFTGFSLFKWRYVWSSDKMLTHWGRVTHICVSELTIIGSDNGLSPGRRQAIIWNNAGLLLIEPLRTNFSEISIGIQTFSFKKMHLNMSSAKWCPFCPGLNVLTEYCKYQLRHQSGFASRLYISSHSKGGNNTIPNLLFSGLWYQIIFFCNWPSPDVPMLVNFKGKRHVWILFYNEYGSAKSISVHGMIYNKLLLSTL